MHETWIDKLDVAQRQISAAVRLHFRNDDPVVIHTVIAAAHQILFDIGKSKGIEGAIKKTEGLKSEEIQEHLRSINYPYNFFKHGDRDSEDKINISPLFLFTQDMLMDAVLMLQHLTSEIPIEAKVYWTWFVSKYPQEFDNLPKDGAIGKLQKLRLADWKLEDIDQFLSFCNIIGPNLPSDEEIADDPSRSNTHVGFGVG